MTTPKTTRLTNTVTAPQPTDPGDAPADTYDPLERAVSVAPDKATAGAAGYQTVNAVIKGDSIPAGSLTGDRTELVNTFDSKGDPTTRVLNYDKGTSAAPLTWVKATAYKKGDYVVITGKVLECTTAGTSDTPTAPTAPGTVGATVGDGTVTWTRRT